MTWKIILLPLLTKIARILLTSVGTSISTFLVARHLASTSDGLTLTNFLADSAPALLGAVPGAAWGIWVWLNKFKFIAKIEAALHLPITGQPSPATVAVAQEAKAIAETAYDASSTIPPYATPPTASPT